jgi:hypothetical protein
VNRLHCCCKRCILAGNAGSSLHFWDVLTFLHVLDSLLCPFTGVKFCLALNRANFPPSSPPPPTGRWHDRITPTPQLPQLIFLKRFRGLGLCMWGVGPRCLAELDVGAGQGEGVTFAWPFLFIPKIYILPCGEQTASLAL